MKDFLPAGLMALGVLGAILIAQLIPPSKGQMVALFPRAATNEDVLAALIQADARLISHGKTMNAVVVWSDQENLPERLREAGAWLVLGPQAAFGCTNNTNASAPPFGKVT